MSFPEAEKENNRPEGLGDGVKHGNATIKLIAFVSLVVLVAFLFKTTSIGYYFSREFIENLLAQMGAFAPLGFILVYTIATVLGVPGTIITLLGGVLFGTLLGGVLVVIGATLGACGAFFVARFLARDFIAEKFGKAAWFRKLDEGMERDGMYYVLFVRLVPVFPFNGLNFASGLTKIRFRDYFIGTAIGITPATFIFVNAAAKAAEAAAGEGGGAGLYISFALLGILILAPMIYQKYKQSPEDQ